MRWHQLLLIWDSRVHDWRDHAIHMIIVAQETVLTRRAAVVTGLTEILFHITEIRYEILWIASLVALQIGKGLFEVMAGQTTAIFQDAYALTYPDRLKMRLMNKIREASPFALGRKRGEIDHPPFARDSVDAVALRA